MARLRVGLVYDLIGGRPAPAGAPADWDAEFEPPATVEALEGALRTLGHAPHRIGDAHALLAEIAAGGPAADVVVNIAEGYGTRNREAQVPVLLEMAGVPFVGSDALALSTTLDKHLTKTILQDVLDTPSWSLARLGDSRPPEPEAFPVMVKPRYEGTAKGIETTSRCSDADSLVREVRRQHALYDQDLIVETFVEGSEYTVGVVGEPPEALPVLQRATERSTGIGAHALPERDATGRRFEHVVAGVLTPDLEHRLQQAAVIAHRGLECRDFSRSDFRVDSAGRAWLLEVNPLPTFAPDGTFAILAELAGRPYRDFLADILSGAISRALTGPPAPSRAAVAR